MALKITKKLYDHLDVTYCRIPQVVLESSLRGKVRMDFFTDQEARLRQNNSEMFKWYPIEWEGSLNYIGDAYSILKSHPDFAGAEDI